MPGPGVVPRRTCAAAVLLLAALLPLRASALEGQVIHVADGDTLTVLDDQHRSHKIRLAGIDAPERSQPFGRRAAEALSALAKNRRVIVSGGKTDRYQRRVGIVRVAPAECAACTPSVDVGLSLRSEEHTSELQSH